MTQFEKEALDILETEAIHKVNSLGGYGPNGEAVYYGHPVNCPSVLVESRHNAKATFMSNGSVGFTVKLEQGMDVAILNDSYDIAEKRDTDYPGSNVWIRIEDGNSVYCASLMNPTNNIMCPARKIKLVKKGEPDRSFWYCAWFKPADDIEFVTAVKLFMTDTESGPALIRNTFVKNLGKKKLKGGLYTYMNLSGTQRFAYNKSVWYDCGMPVADGESVINATVPYSDILQIKRLSSRVHNLSFSEATCDRTSFVGNTADSPLFPAALKLGKLLNTGAKEKMNRFAAATIGANIFEMNLLHDATASVCQMLLYVNNKAVVDNFRNAISCDEPTYSAISRDFKSAAVDLIKNTVSPESIIESRAQQKLEQGHPDFEIAIPNDPVMALYANSAWMTVKELYENCRAHGAKLADGIELGTRDRGQDMWPKIKEDPARVRADLIHAFGMMYWTTDEFPFDNKTLKLREKLHGMFPRQYPSAWKDRSKVVMCDNRPYADSPLWLINAFSLYIKETGDTSILLEEVTTVKLVNPDDPIRSGIIGNNKKQLLIDSVIASLNCFERLADDSPYGMAQVMYGDWCDPIDMFGTDVVGNTEGRGKGRGVQARLSAHLFICLTEVIDILLAKDVQTLLNKAKVLPDINKLTAFVNRLRKNTCKHAYEDGEKETMPGFVSWIHMLQKDGSLPSYSKGQIGYTLGSMRGQDFDGVNRRDLGAMSYALEMVRRERSYLEKIADRDQIIGKMLYTVDNLFLDPKLGLLLFTKPISNNSESTRLVGRMGLLPSGCAENGEYHHGQIIMHTFRAAIPGEVNNAYQQIKPIISSMKDES
ncbi:MAG: hypothetical protein JNL74_23160, partial [Fibrobacteres bacterium]|nr:hypothetical protein [Fibrobacterota bacterium]